MLNATSEVNYRNNYPDTKNSKNNTNIEKINMDNPLDSSSRDIGGKSKKSSSRSPKPSDSSVSSKKKVHAKASKKHSKSKEKDLNASSSSIASHSRKEKHRSGGGHHHSSSSDRKKEKSLLSSVGSPEVIQAIVVLQSWIRMWMQKRDYKLLLLQIEYDERVAQHEQTLLEIQANKVKQINKYTQSKIDPKNKYNTEEDLDYIKQIQKQNETLCEKIQQYHDACMQLKEENDSIREDNAKSAHVHEMFKNEQQKILLTTKQRLENNIDIYLGNIQNVQLSLTNCLKAYYIETNMKRIYVNGLTDCLTILQDTSSTDNENSKLLQEIITKVGKVQKLDKSKPFHPGAGVFLEEEAILRIQAFVRGYLARLQFCNNNGSVSSSTNKPARRSSEKSNAKKSSKDKDKEKDKKPKKGSSKSKDKKSSSSSRKKKTSRVESHKNLLDELRVSNHHRFKFDENEMEEENNNGENNDDNKQQQPLANTSEEKDKKSSSKSRRRTSTRKVASDDSPVRDTSPPRSKSPNNSVPITPLRKPKRDSITSRRKQEATRREASSRRIRSGDRNHRTPRSPMKQRGDHSSPSGKSARDEYLGRSSKTGLHMSMGSELDLSSDGDDDENDMSESFGNDDGDLSSYFKGPVNNNNKRSKSQDEAFIEDDDDDDDGSVTSAASARSAVSTRSMSSSVSRRHRIHKTRQQRPALEGLISPRRTKSNMEGSLRELVGGNYAAGGGGGVGVPLTSRAYSSRRAGMKRANPNHNNNSMRNVATLPKNYDLTYVDAVILIQSLVRAFLQRRRFLRHMKNNINNFDGSINLENIRMRSNGSNNSSNGDNLSLASSKYDMSTVDSSDFQSPDQSATFFSTVYTGDMDGSGNGDGSGKLNYDEDGDINGLLGGGGNGSKRDLIPPESPAALLKKKGAKKKIASMLKRIKN